MTQERITEIAGFVAKHEKEVNGLLAAPPQEVAEKITGMGFPITTEEFVEFCSMIDDAGIKGDGTELGDEDLENVSGGVVVAIIGLGILTYAIFAGLGNYIEKYR